MLSSLEKIKILQGELPGAQYKLKLEDDPISTCIPLPILVNEMTK